MHQPRYCLAHQPGISSNVTNATHFSMPLTSPTLAHQPPYPCWPTTLVTYVVTSPTLARQPRNPRQHDIHASMLPMHVRHPRYSLQHAILSSMNSTPFLKLFKNLKKKQDEKIIQKEKINQKLGPKINQGRDIKARKL